MTQTTTIHNAIQPYSNWVTSPCVPFECILGACTLDSGIRVKWYVGLCKLRPMIDNCWRFNTIVLFVNGKQVKSISDFTSKSKICFFDFFVYINEGKIMPSLN